MLKPPETTRPAETIESVECSGFPEAAKDPSMAELVSSTVSLIQEHLSLDPHPAIRSTEWQNLLNQVLSGTPSHLRQRLEEEFRGCGPLSPLLEDPEVNEILLQGPYSLWFEKDGRLYRQPDGFYSELTFSNFIHRLTQEAGLRIDLSRPFVDGLWRGFRTHLAMAPLVSSPYTLTLRRHPDLAWSLNDLEQKGMFSSQQKVVLKDILQQKKNILFVGPTSSGKTTLLNACLLELGPSAQRVLCIEDTSELKLPNDLSVQLLTRDQGFSELNTVNQGELVRQCLRMRPDRIVMGEIRGSEAKDFLMALATGHKGSMGSIHADSAQQALWRLEMLIQMGAPQWSLSAVRQLIGLSLDGLVCLNHQGGQRRLISIHQVASVEERGVLLDPLFL